MAKTLDLEGIKGILPHREPFLMIDEVTDFEPGVSCTALKHVSADEPYFKGHFPGYPVMPGVLILEAIAQTGAIALLGEPANQGKIALFGGAKNARFKQQVRPGDTLEISCTLGARKGPLGFGDGVAMLDGKVACKATISFAVMD
ncbi:MAG: 3-hydroxyacyl-ACP dehydratase FabZ [Coriobacteriales bacterium]|jgi:3-hydroxyacyl-[acyl-carrier-protein] dehydratase|nr:3-hydroxyacyl-ACP dehydratase FabZ [Coriobacteriales bacterium]